MFIAHRVFLQWLLYVVIVVFAGSVLTFFGLPQLIIQYDHVYLGTTLILLYMVAEILAGRQAVKVSNENLRANTVRAWLDENVLRDVIVRDDDVVLVGHDDQLVVPKSLIKNHLRNLVRRARLNPNLPINQRVLLNSLADRIYFDVLIGDFIGSRITWVGILATVVGVIMALWPFVSKSGIDLDVIRANLGPFFQGVAVAFIPTAVSFVFKIALDFNTRILISGVNELLDTVTEISEVHALPVLALVDATEED